MLNLPKPCLKSTPKTGPRPCWSHLLETMKIVDVERPDRPRKPYGLRWYVHRKAKHRFFPNKEAREKFRVKLSKQAASEGRLATQLKSWEAIDYVRAREELAGTNLSVLDAVKEYMRLRPVQKVEKSLGDALDEYTEAKKRNVSAEHLRQIKRALDTFRASFSRLDIEPKEIRAWLDGLPFQNITKQNYRKKVNAFYAFAIKHEWIDGNPVSAVEAPRVVEKEVGLLTPEETSYLFRANQDAPPAALARLALEAFAGLRYTTAARIEYSDIKWDLNGINLPAARLKTERRQFIDGLPDNLWEWLVYCRDQSNDWNMEQRNYLYHKTRSFDKATLLYRQEHGGEGAIPHPKNALRHSFASYHVALNKSPSKTATILCHTSERKLWSHYKGRATEADAKVYFRIGPNKFDA